MKTDIHCKVLAQRRPEDLLVLIGEQGAQLLSTDVIELPAIKRTVDFVFKLQRGDQVYFRHLEFQAELDPELNRRCFVYDALLLDQYQVPVLTTIIYLFRHRELPEPVFRVELAGREINRWQFDCIRLWELEAQAALDQGLPGLAALVPLMNAVQWEHIEQAVHQIETKAPAEHQSDLLAILREFGQHRYTIEQLERLIGRERLMESSIYKWGLEEGQAKGRTEGLAEGRVAGQLAEARDLCRKVVRKWHRRVSNRVLKAIEKCTDLSALEEVTLNASEWSPREIIQRLAEQ
jgi:predicted transposase YdaD